MSSKAHRLTCSRGLVDAHDDTDGPPVGFQVDPHLLLPGKRREEVLILVAVRVGRNPTGVAAGCRSALRSRGIVGYLVQRASGCAHEFFFPTGSLRSDV